MSRTLLFGITLLFLVSCSNISQHPISNNSLSNNQNELKQFNVTNCTKIGLLPKGNSVNTMSLEGVILYKCTLENLTCYYIQPNGYLGGSISCVR